MAFPAIAPVRRACLFVAALGWATMGGAWEETQDPWIRGVFTGASPRVERVAAATAWERAERLAASDDAVVLLGTGRSMLPLYPPGTILVVRKVGYDQLCCGQTAIYRNREQRAVAHVLITKARDGWRTRGLNNRLHDMQPVRAENLLGVVIAAYHPAGEGARLDALRARAAAARAARGGAAVFLADDGR